MTSAAGRGTGGASGASRRPRRSRRSTASPRRTRRRTCPPSRSRAAGRGWRAHRARPPPRRRDSRCPRRRTRGAWRSRAASDRAAHRRHPRAGPHRPDLALQPDVPAHLARGTTRDPVAAWMASRARRGAGAQHAPESRIRRRSEAAEHDRRRGALREPRGLARLAVLVEVPDRRVIVRVAGEHRREVVEASGPARRPRRRPGTRLLQPAERLVQRRAEGPVDGHHLAGRLHLAAEAAIRARELVEREARQLDHHVVQRRLERRHRGPVITFGISRADARSRSAPRREQSGSRSPSTRAPRSARRAG